MMFLANDTRSVLTGGSGKSYEVGKCLCRFKRSQDIYEANNDFCTSIIPEFQRK
jgi:hypothetical protein